MRSIKQLLIVSIALFTSCHQKKAQPQLSSRIRDSLDYITVKITGLDLCSLFVIDNLNYAIAAHEAEKVYPFSDVAKEANEKRMALEEKNYKFLADSTVAARKWPKGIWKFVNDSELKLDTPCLKISKYRIRNLAARDYLGFDN